LQVEAFANAFPGIHRRLAVSPRKAEFSVSSRAVSDGLCRAGVGCAARRRPGAGTGCPEPASISAGSERDAVVVATAARRDGRDAVAQPHDSIAAKVRRRLPAGLRRQGVGPGQASPRGRTRAPSWGPADRSASAWSNHAGAPCLWITPFRAETRQTSCAGIAAPEETGSGSFSRSRTA
jgi:hypothetical protein